MPPPWRPLPYNTFKGPWSIQVQAPSRFKTNSLPTQYLYIFRRNLTKSIAYFLNNNNRMVSVMEMTICSVRRKLDFFNINSYMNFRLKLFMTYNDADLNPQMISLDFPQKLVTTITILGHLCRHLVVPPTASPPTNVSYVLISQTFLFERAIRWSLEFSASPGVCFPQTTMAILVYVKTNTNSGTRYCSTIRIMLQQKHGVLSPLHTIYISWAVFEVYRLAAVLPAEG